MTKHRRIFARYARTLKTFSLAAFAGLCVLAGAGLVASCSNIGADYDGPASNAQTAGVQAAEGVLVAKVAMPNMPSIKRQKSGSPKSAFPGLLQAAGSAFSFEATLSSAAATYSTSGTFDDTTSTCDFAFAGALSDAEQTYTLSVQLYHKSGLGAEKKLVASGSQTVTVAGGDTSFAANVSLLPNTDAAAPKGSVGLSIKFSDATSVTNLTVQFKDSAGTDWADDYLDGGSTVNLTGGEGTISSAADKIPAGSYTLLMTFNKVTAEGTMVVGSRTESVNVYPAMETNSWWTNGAPTDTLDISKNEQTEFWVKGTGGKFYTELYTAAPEAKDTNIGSFAAPLATIQAAVDRIKTIGNTTTQYTIYIDGKVTGAADANYGSAKNFALVNVTGEREILFKGWTGPDKDIIDVNKYDGSSKPLYPGHAFAIATESKITLQNLCLTKASGDATDGSSNGGAIFVGASSADADVTIINSKISGNLAVNGGGIAISKGKVLLKQCVVTDNEASSNGGGIYANGSTVDRPSFTIEDSEISFNKATGTGSSSGGGGLYVGNYAKAYFKSGLVGSDDSANGNTGKYGGGVYVNSNGKFYMSGSSRVGGNTASSNGGGIYNGGTVYMSGSAIVGADPSSLTDTAKKEAAQEADGKHSNMAYAGGGIYTSSPAGIKLGWVDESNPDTAFAGGIYYNCAKSSSGGGVYSNSVSGKTFDLERGSVCYNGAKGYGGGICVYFSGTTGSQITMTGGEVSCNSAKDGGGVYAFDASISGGTIAGNTASDYGGGVYASSDFYLYGTGVIGDDGTHEVAEADDCSNKAKAGGGVYSHKVYIGYSAASTPAACTGGIYRNYATATSTSDDNCYGGGGICIKGTSADWLFMMQSGTVAYNAGDSSDGYGGGLYIYGSGASLQDPEATGGSFVGNGAKYGGAVCCYTDSFAVGGSVHMPSATGEKGDNDIYISNDTCCLRLESAFDAATPTPVLTATPSAYSPGKKIFEEDDALLPTNCEKVAIASDGSGAPWAVSNKGLLVKDCAECYVSQTTGGDDTSHDGSFSKPYKSIYYAAKQFSNKTAPLGGTEYKPTFKNIIYVLSDMTFTLGAGADIAEACNYEVVGRAGDVAGSPVTFTFNTDSGSGFYVPATHIVMLKNINITQDQTTCPTIAYAAIQADGGTLYMEDCSITGIKAKNCSAIAADGDGGAGKVYLKNVSIKDNVTVPNVSGGSVWGPAVSVKTGNLYISGKVEICDNTMEGYGKQNVWIGENSGTPVFHPIVVAGKLSTGTSIGVTTYDISATEFTTGYKAAGNTAEPRTYFASDNEMQVVWNTAVDEAELKLPTTIYVSSTSASPAGNDTTGDGSLTKPYATLQKALNVLDGYGVAANNYTIIVNGQILGASTIKSGINATKITVQGKTGASSDKLKGSSSAAVLTISDTIPVDISDLTITGGQRGVNMAAAATVTITDCEITENTGSVSGTGVYVYAGGSITITDTNITKNTANGSSSSGGGIYVATSTGLTHFEVSGGSISNNTAKEGGAATLHCQNGITPILSGVTISANKATSGNAGGIYVPNGRYLNITDCEISGNTATGGNGGGGLYVVGTCNVYGSTTISGNTATSGAGGGIYNSGTCNIYGSIAISANNASSGNGGGVFNSGTCKIYGSTTISGNTAIGGNGGGIYTTGTCYIYGSTKIGDSSASGTAAAESATGKHSNMATATTGSTPTGGQGGGIYNGGNLYIGYSAWSGTSGTASALTSGGGVYYNYAASTGGGIYNAASKTLVIGSGTYKRNASASGGGGVFTAGAFTMNNGTIDSNSAVLGGGGVYSAKGGSFTMANGTISSNKATGTPGSGGGVCAIGTFSMTTGTIKNNSAKYGGGLYVANTATMQNGYITENSASVNGAGVHIEVSDSTLTPKFTLSGGEISSNAVSSTSASGGGISNKDGTLIISGGTITSNDGGQLGGGILSMSTSSMSAGTISGNSSSVGGGGIYTNSGTFTMTGGTISGNSSVAGGGVCVGENSTFSFTAGTISTNTVTTSSGKGGAAFIQAKSSTSSTDGVFKIGSSATIPAGDSSGATGAGKNDVYTEAKLTISSAVSGTTPVATITPPTYDTGLQVLTGTSALLSGYHGKFAVTPNSVGAWSIDEYGYLRQEASGSGSVTIYTPDGQLVLTADKTAIAASGATTVTLTAKNASGSNITSSSDITAWKIEVYYGASLTLVNSATTNKYTFAATYPAGTYRMTVSVTYKGVTYTDTIVLAK